MRIAIACDYIASYEDNSVLKSIHEIFPKAKIYTAQCETENLPDWLKSANLEIGWPQKLSPHPKKWLTLFRQAYFKNLKIYNCDLLITISETEAKSIKKGSALHICYCKNPSTLYWSLYDDYSADPGYGKLNNFVRAFTKFFIKPFRKIDFSAAKNVDYFLVPSSYSQKQLKKYYKRGSIILAPPVPVENFCTGNFSTTKTAIKQEKSQGKKEENKTINNEKRQGYIVATRQILTSRLDLAVKSCLSLNEPLTLVGDGPEHSRLKKFVRKNPLVTFLPPLNDKTLKTYFENSKAYLSPGLSPFDSDSIKALASGCPVISYSKGGAIDYLVDGENGILFNNQSAQSLTAAIKKFKSKTFSENLIKKSTTQFSETVFKNNFKLFLRKVLKF